MRNRALLTAFVAGLLYAGLSHAGAQVPEAEPPASAEEQKAFDDLYQERIKKARTPEDRVALAREMLAGAGGTSGGLQYLFLTTAKDLAVRAGDADLAIQALKPLLDLDRGDAKTLRGDLVDLMVQRFEQSAKTAAASKGAEAALFKLANEIVEHALTLGQAYRSGLNFAAAERAEQKALKPATIVGSPRLPQLRQTLAIDEMLAKLVSMARGHEQRKMTELAISEYLDAGLVDEAARLIAQEPNETAALLIRVAQDRAAAPADLLAAAKAWDKRAIEAKETLQTIRLSRAAELYERYMAVGEGIELTAAKVRLQAIHQKLGDLAGALRRKSEWVYLVDLQEVSAGVGWGSFHKAKRGDKPVGIAGHAFATGLYVHAPSRVVYLLRGQYSEFSFCYGMGSGAGGAASFEVICDGKSIWQSAGMWSNHTQGVRNATVLRVAGVEKLELVTKAVAVAGAHAWWGDPKVR